MHARLAILVLVAPALIVSGSALAAGEAHQPSALLVKIAKGKRASTTRGASSKLAQLIAPNKMSAALRHEVFDGAAEASALAKTVAQRAFDEGVYEANGRKEIKDGRSAYLDGVMPGKLDVSVESVLPSGTKLRHTFTFGYRAETGALSRVELSTPNGRASAVVLPGQRMIISHRRPDRTNIDRTYDLDGKRRESVTYDGERFRTYTAK